MNLAETRPPQSLTAYIPKPEFPVLAIMPEPGFQHTLGGITSCNPFDEEPTKLSPYTVEEIATLQSRLDKQLGPEYISSRPGPSGTKIHYLAADKVINLANEVFGFNGWSSSIRNIQIDFVGSTILDRLHD